MTREERYRAGLRYGIQDLATVSMFQRIRKPWDDQKAEQTRLIG